MSHAIRAVGDQAKLWASLLLFAAFGLTWSVVAIPAYMLLPRQLGTRIGRLGFNRLTWLYVSWLALIGAYRLDLSAMDALRRGPAVILAPNHPSMIDAVLILSAHPRMVCVMKSVLKNNVILGSGARLAQSAPADGSTSRRHGQSLRPRGAGPAIPRWRAADRRRRRAPHP